VVLNLALNALDAAMNSRDVREVEVGTAIGNEEVEIYVRDNGVGLPADVQSHLFQSFFSTKPNGLGLGLVIVRSIVERHQGRVRAENVETGGALFRVLLPRVTADSSNG
jgi:signal transduction histidine kinase